MYALVRKFESYGYFSRRSDRDRDDRLPRETPRWVARRRAWLVVGALVPIVVVAIVFTVGAG